MNVVFLSRLYKPHVGGVEKHIEEIGTRLTKQGVKLSVITTKHSKNLLEKEKVGGIKVIRFSQPYVKYLGLIYTWFWFIKNIKIIKEADVVHIHDVFIWYLPVRFLLPHKKVFITFHGYPDYPIPKKAIFLQKLAEKLTCGNICIGKFIEKWFGTKADTVSYGAVDIKKYKPAKIRKHRYDALFASRLDKHTGIQIYLQAIKILKDKGVNFSLVVLGDGKYFPEAKKLARAVGWVKDTSPYFKNAKFAFVNRYLAILEALASKKLVFAVYDNPLKKDYLFMTPYKNWMVIAKEPKKLAEKIILYSKNPKKANTMVEKGYNWAKNQSWEKLTNQYLKLWKKTEKP